MDHKKVWSMPHQTPFQKETNVLLKIFVYGTLKRGFADCDRHCRGVSDIQEAQVRGRLYGMPSGIPVLSVPEESILARGTRNGRQDAVTQARMAVHLAKNETNVEWDVAPARANPWRFIRGELLAFDDPDNTLQAIDALEGFRPEAPSLYRRVLAPILTGETVTPAWLYVVEDLARYWLAEHDGDSWP